MKTLNAIALRDYIDDNGVFICTQGQNVTIIKDNKDCLVKTSCGWYEADVEDFEVKELNNEVSGVFKKRIW